LPADAGRGPVPRPRAGRAAGGGRAPAGAPPRAPRAARAEGQGVSLRALILTTFGRLAQEGVFEEGVAPSSCRVYLAILDGRFAVHRSPWGSLLQADHLNLAIDAWSGSVLAAGTSDVTEDPRLLDRVRVHLPSAPGS
ncbi:MAG: hypothetical protein K6T75_00005, partial [Acetobacteraceae bacterium]|nr:hypothetical protein [Acetobacteraceae bacterium]